MLQTAQFETEHVVHAVILELAGVNPFEHAEQIAEQERKGAAAPDQDTSAVGLTHLDGRSYGDPTRCAQPQRAPRATQQAVSSWRGSLRRGFRNPSFAW